CNCVYGRGRPACGPPDRAYIQPPGPHTQVCPYADLQFALVKRISGKDFQLRMITNHFLDFDDPFGPPFVTIREYSCSFVAKISFLKSNTTRNALAQSRRGDDLESGLHADFSHFPDGRSWGD